MTKEVLDEKLGVLVSADEWQPSDYEIDVECPYCHSMGTYYSDDVPESMDCHCDDCDRDFTVSTMF